jgi:hypothetical protein
MIDGLLGFCNWMSFSFYYIPELENQEGVDVFKRILGQVTNWLASLNLLSAHKFSEVTNEKSCSGLVSRREYLTFDVFFPFLLYLLFLLLDQLYCRDAVLIVFQFI